MIINIGNLVFIYILFKIFFNRKKYSITLFIYFFVNYIQQNNKVLVYLVIKLAFHETNSNGKCYFFKIKTN